MLPDFVWIKHVFTIQINCFMVLQIKRPIFIRVTWAPCMLANNNVIN